MSDRSPLLTTTRDSLAAHVRAGNELDAYATFARLVYIAHATEGCEAQGVPLGDLPRLGDVVARTADRVDRLRDILDCEIGVRAPDGWSRNDIDPKHEGLAWYRRWEVGAAEPGDDDTENTRVAWVRHDPDVSMITWSYEIEAPASGVFAKLLCEGRDYATALEAIEAAMSAATERNEAPHV